MLVRSLAATCLFVVVVGAAPAVAQVVDAPHWLVAATGSQSCDRQPGELVRVPAC